MRRLVWVAVVGLGCVLAAGCAPVASEPVAPVESQSPVTPLPEPSPTWSESEQAAIDAVYAYLEKWTLISQNLQDTSQWATLRDVAVEPLFPGVWKRWEA